MNLNRLGLCEIVDLLRRGEVSPVDVARDLVSAVEARNPVLHAYLHFDPEQILAEAKRLADGAEYRDTPLCGAPIAIKDNICTLMTPTTCASRILDGYQSPYAATVVERIIGAGGWVAGKTNLDEFAMGSSTENSGFGPASNPWNHECSPGGSSGGSAAAVASDTAIAALGSDTGGSIRQPASFCGVVGLKPTYGRVSRYGLVAFASSLDQIGPLTKSVSDAALLLSVIGGKDPHDATSLSAPVPHYTDDLGTGIDGVTFGLPRDFLDVEMDAEVRQNFDEQVDRLRAGGAKVIDVSLPSARHAIACYYIIANAEASSNLARYDGVKYGHRTKDPGEVYTMYTRTRDEGFGEEVKRRILLGTYVLSAGYYDAYYLQAQKVRSLVIDDLKVAFDACDLILLPTSPTPAFRLGEKIDNPLEMYAADVFTIPVNLAGLPGISIPSGLSSAGLPFGLQIVGRALDEPAVFRAARHIEQLIAFDRKAYEERRGG